MTVVAPQSIHVHALCWNAREMLPHFFRCYDRWADRYHIWDLGSDDGSLSLLQAHPSVELHQTSLDGNSVIDGERELCNRAWTSSRNRADWVILVAIDEHLHHPDLRAYLRACTSAGITALRASGYEMTADEFPSNEQLLCEQIVIGCRSSGLDRLCVFSPSALTSTRFSPGLHHAWPEGHVVWPASSELLLLRFRLLGEAYFVERGLVEGARLRPGDVERGWAGQQSWTDKRWGEHAAMLRQAARPVPGLGALAGMPPDEYRGDEKTVEFSGLLDEVWYLSRYPDVQAQNTSALPHFCHYGWREGRQPNPYFDPAWYSAKHAERLSPDTNPLVNYITVGESDNLQPSPHFDPAWYRSQHELAADESPLRHFLLRRQTGTVSPLPAFDVEDYLAQNPELRGSSQDPYLHWLRRAEAGPGKGTSPGVLPSFEVLVAFAGGNLGEGVMPSQVSWDTLLKVIQQFLPLVPFDEAWYTGTYPDVAEAVRSEHFESAHAHFVTHGFFEGRRPIPPETTQ